MHTIVDAEATLKWALFSGDFNPIHFDRAMARAVGSEQLVAHGMNVLLGAKQALDDQRSPRNGWQQVSCMLRKPVAQGRPLSLALCPRGGDLAFALRYGTDECVRGVARATPAPSGRAPGPVGVRFDIEAERVQRKRLAFTAAFPFATRPWIFLDALVFSHLLGDPFNRAAAGLERLEVPGQRRLVMQISHRVTFDANAIDRLFEAPHGPPPLAYLVERPQTIVDGGAESGTVDVTTLVDDRVVMQQEIGLLSRNLTSGDGRLDVGALHVHSQR